jgi:integrase
MPFGSVRIPIDFQTLLNSNSPIIPEKSKMTDTSPTIVNRTLPIKLPNSAYRVREYLTEAEVGRLIEAARKRGRNGARDAAAIILAYRHGLRASELCSLGWTQIDLRHGRLHVNRAKGGIESVHPLHGPELRALRPLQGKSAYVFVTEGGTPVTTTWFLRMIQRTHESSPSCDQDRAKKCLRVHSRALPMGSAGDSQQQPTKSVVGLGLT